MLTLLLLCQLFAPPVPAETLHQRVVLFGDSQDDAGRVFRQVVAGMVAESPDLVVTLGDLIQHGRRDAQAPELEWRPLFLDPMGQLLQVPRIGCRGNHDSNVGHQTIVCPLPLQAGVGLWDAFDIGECLWAVGDANDETFELRTSMDPGRPQRVWIDNLIASERWRRARWRFFVTHQPAVTNVWYSSCAYANYATPQWIALGDRLSAAGCHVWWSGHAHGLEHTPWRTGRMWRITSGGGGGALDVVCGTNYLWAAAAHGFHSMRVTPTALDIRAVSPLGHTLQQLVIQ